MSDTRLRKHLHRTRPSRISGDLRLREALFVQFYLAEAHGNGRLAARLAAYGGSAQVLDVQAARLLRRPRVREAIQHALQAEAERRGLSKEFLVEKAHAVLLENHPFERLKALELLAKLLGYFSPTLRVAETVTHAGESSYAGLADTLGEHADHLTPEQKSSLRKRILNDIADAQRALEALDGFNAAS